MTLTDRPQLFPTPLAATGTTTFIDNMRLPVHRWFRYSAGFSAQWVESIVPKGARVLDPFAGSGTTLIAAQAVGAESFGIDSQEFVCRVAQAKLAWVADADELERRGALLLDAHAPHETDASMPALLESCYTDEALADLLGLRDLVAKDSTDDPVRALLWLALVSIIRPTSHAGTAQWQYVLPKKRKRSTTPVLGAFEGQVALMAADMRIMQGVVGLPPKTVYVEDDSRKLGVVPDGWATHIVCSPPYANNFDYADATRLEQTVLGEVSSWADLKGMRSRLVRSCSQAMNGYDPGEALSDPILSPIIDELSTVYEELGSVRERHAGKKAYHNMVLAYFHDLAYTWRALRHASIEGATVCFVVGDSAPYGVHVPVERWLGTLAVSEGFQSWTFEKVRDRNVKWKNRKHDVPLHEGRLQVVG
jgi:hypothetical protein